MRPQLKLSEIDGLLVDRVPQTFTVVVFFLRSLPTMPCSNMSGPVRVNHYNPPWFRVGVTKAVWAAWRIALPLLLWRVPAAQFWQLFAIAEVTSGFWLAWNFEVRAI